MFEELDMFAVVVEQSSINQASKALNLSQPALSENSQAGGPARAAVQPPGQTAGAYLHRTDRLHLCPGGGRSNSCRRWPITGRGSDLDQLGSQPDHPSDDLAPLVNAFMERHPAAEIKLITGKTHEIVSYVRDKRVDVGIVASSINQPGLNCIPLFDDHLELVIPSSHPLAELDDVGIERLQGLPMIIFSTGTWYRKLTDDLFHRWGIMPDIRMEIDSFEAIVRLIPTCKAAALLPKSYLRPRAIRQRACRHSYSGPH